MSVPEGERLQETSPWGQFCPKRCHRRYSLLLSAPSQAAPSPNGGSSVRPGAAVALCQHSWWVAAAAARTTYDSPLPPARWPAPSRALRQQTQVSQQVAVWGARQTVCRAGRGSPAQLGMASLPNEGHHHWRGGHGRVLTCQIAAVALGGFGWDHSPSPVFGVIGRGISSGTWVTFAELSEGFRHMLSTPVNARTLSLHLWKALKITLGPCRNSHSSWVTGHFQK